MINQQELKERLTEIFKCASAWDDDDGKMAEANVLTPEDILAGYFNEEREKIYADLLKIADDNELEDMRREITRYFTNNENPN